MASWAEKAAAAASIQAPQQAPSTTTTTSKRQNNDKLTPENQALFSRAVRHVYARWALIRMALELGWGNSDGNETIEVLIEETIDLFKTKRNVREDYLEDCLTGFIGDNFSVVAEDGSPREVALILTKLFAELEKGDTTFVNHLLAQPIPDGPAVIEQPGAEDSDDEDDFEDEEEEPGTQPAPQPPQTQLEPVQEASEAQKATENPSQDENAMEDDGWNVVPAKKKSGKKNRKK